ncbi:D-alanine--D-alanine ligase [Longirhabdus pacifica]|uniref:D-alanine--D-alanine ligase n=1 Tax=Longirhabdus pacifica TaxID=2305227 RepID=UPI0010090E51|nr:D-alanine--D-alanine ligase [Longirhabdus pacifica]
MKKTRVGIVYGGRSGEHEVSLTTAFSVISSLDFERYEVVPFYINKEGHWFSSSPLSAPLQQQSQLLLQEQGESLASPLPTLLGQHKDKDQSIDVMFPLLHGTYGEDGTIQGFFEMLQMPYVGCGVLASAVGMDKVMMKKIFAESGLPQSLYRYFNRNQWENNAEYYIMEIEVTLGYPCFVKPANLGSSVGISKVQTREQLMEAVSYALQFDHKVIVEEFVDGREIEVGVLGNDNPEASVLGEIGSDGEFYDYNAKYKEGKTEMIIPAELPSEQVQYIQQLAIRAFQAIDGSGLSRVDFFIGRDNDKVYINEINTMPGFTPYSMYPMLWQASGVSYTKLLDTLITLSIERFKHKNQLRYELE